MVLSPDRKELHCYRQAILGGEHRQAELQEAGCPDSGRFGFSGAFFGRSAFALVLGSGFERASGSCAPCLWSPGGFAAGWLSPFIFALAATAGAAGLWWASAAAADGARSESL